MNDNNFNIAVARLLCHEGGYTNGANQISDLPTNMGITQDTLNKYRQRNHAYNMPRDVKDLTIAQVKEIYKVQYWDNTKIPLIRNARIRNAVFDMYVMGPVGAGKTLQRALNEFLSASLTIDGVIGVKTISAINSISETKTDEFMRVLIRCRIQNLQSMVNWPTAHRGWVKRTMGY